MDVFRPYRPQSNYGAPGYGIYPTRPGSYLNGLGDIVMEPGSNYGAWGYQAGGGQHTPFGNRGYGIYGFGEGEELTFQQRVEALKTPTKFGIGAAVGVVAGLAIGYFVYGR